MGMMQSDTVARIISELTEGGRWRMIQATELTDLLADAAEAEAKEQCPVLYAGGFCLVHQKFNRTNFLHIAQATP